MTNGKNYFLIPDNCCHLGRIKTVKPIAGLRFIHFYVRVLKRLSVNLGSTLLSFDEHGTES